MKNTTGEKGNKGLANVIADLVNKEYSIFLPLSDTTCVDLIVSNNEMNFKRVQIKYRSINKHGTLEVSTSTVINGKRIRADLNKTDLWAIYCPNNKNIYYVSTKELKGKKLFVLRVNSARFNTKLMNHAENYLDILKAWNK